MKRYPLELSLLLSFAAGSCLAAVPEPVTLEGHRGSVLAVAFSPDGKLLASGGAAPSDDPKYSRGEVIVWDAATREKQRVLAGHPGNVTCLAFSPDGKILASGGHRQHTPVAYDTQQNLKLWDVPTGREIATFLGQGDEVTCVAFSPDGNTLASGSIDGTVKLRLADREWKVRATLKPPTRKTSEEGVFTLAFHPQGTWLATGCEGGTIEIWDLTTLRLKTKLRVHEVEKHGVFVVLSPDGKTLVTSDRQGAVQLRDTGTFQIRDSFKTNLKDVWELALSPDGKTLATAAGKWDKADSVVLWDVSTHKRIAAFEGHAKGVTSLAFSGDGKLLASASFDGTVKLWPLSETAGQKPED